MGEQADLKKLREDIAKAHDIAFSVMRDYLRATPEALKAAGHTSVDSAILYTVNRTIKECDSLRRAYVKKYPD